MTRSKLTEAREQLSAAHTDSLDAPRLASEAGGDAQEHLFTAELKLRQAGRMALARRLEAVLEGDVTTTAARTVIREIADEIDAELSPTVDATTAFRAASDGGVGDE